MWKIILASCLLFGLVCLGAGCAETSSAVPFAVPPPPPQIRPLLPAPDSNESVVMGHIMLGNVGKPIGRDYYTVHVNLDEPTQLRCNVSFRPLADAPTPASKVALNIQLTGPGTDHVACSETLYQLRKELSCAVKKRGVFILTFQSANPYLAVIFGFQCLQTPQKVDSVVIPTPPVRVPGHGPGGSSQTSAEDPPAPTVRLTKRIDETMDGQDDRHKILILLPCVEPLKGSGGSIKIGKSSSRRYIVHKSKTCEVEVSDVPDSMLEADTQVILTQ